MQPLVSIVMPVKNALPYLKACLNSIIEQSYIDWELIAINDGSDDDSKALLIQYALLDDRITTLNNDDQGIIPALQLAYKHTTGDLITRMDADDLMMPDRISYMVDALEGQPQSIAVGQVEYFSADGKLGDGYRKYQDWLNDLTADGDNFTEIYKECVIPSPCWMMHRDDFDALGGFEADRYPEDYDLAFRMYQSKNTVIPCDQVLHRWRDYPTRTSRTDDNYADNRFLDIKVHYFITIDYNSDRPLVLWGAGKKGKQIAQLLINKGINFRWICDNPKKIGHDIYGVVLEGTDFVNDFEDSQVIVAVAGEEGNQIQTQISNTNSRSELYWFC